MGLFHIRMQSHTDRLQLQNQSGCLPEWDVEAWVAQISFDDSGVGMGVERQRWGWSAKTTGTSLCVAAIRPFTLLYRLAQNSATPVGLLELVVVRVELHADLHGQWGSCNLARAYPPHLEPRCPPRATLMSARLRLQFLNLLNVLIIDNIPLRLPFELDGDPNVCFKNGFSSFRGHISPQLERGSRKVRGILPQIIKVDQICVLLSSPLHTDRERLAQDHLPGHFRCHHWPFRRPHSPVRTDSWTLNARGDKSGDIWRVGGTLRGGHLNGAGRLSCGEERRVRRVLLVMEASDDCIGHRTE